MIKIAIAVTQGHVQRAIEFFNKLGKYFIVGGTTPWADESNPPSPTPNDYKLNNVVGLKRIDHCQLVVPDPNGTISYRTQNWRVVLPPFSTNVSSVGITANAMTIPVVSLEGLTVGSKIRIASTYEAKITKIDNTTRFLTVDTPAPKSIPSGAIIEGGALVEGAKYVYVDCYLNYDQFPIVTYRQIGLCTEVTHNQTDGDILRSAEYSNTKRDEYTSLGVLEIIDNRNPSTRDIDQRELLSIICEF